MHRLLARQLRKLGLDGEPPDQETWQAFKALVEQAYLGSDQERYTLERSLEISSEEMMALYKRQKSSYEARLHAVLDAMPDIVFLFDDQGRYLEIMSGNEEALVLPKKELKGKLVSDVLPEDDARYFVEVIHKALDKGDLTIIEYPIELPDGLKWFEGRIVPTDLTVDGRRTVVFMAIEITDRRKAELRERLISSMFEGSQEGMIILDGNMQLLSANAAFGRIMEVEPDECIGVIPPPLDRAFDDPQESLQRAMLDRDRRWIGEISSRRVLSNELFPLWLSINAVTDSAGDVSNYVVLMADVSELKRSKEELEYVATHDPLTGLPNRLLFQDRLTQAVNRARRQNSTGALFFLDLDRFKVVNDSLGHQVGDELLIRVAKRLQQACRDTDTLARLGGDEFTLIAESIEHKEDLVAIADKVLEVFSLPFQLDQYSLDISVSVGISVFPDDSADPHVLVKHADTAMFAAKEAGRNNYHFYTQDLTDTAVEFFAMEVALQRALENEEFVLHYQPQFAIGSGELVGVEALIRWQHPEKGLLYPKDFIEFAETTGHIHAIGDWVLREACRQCKQWREQTGADICMSINLSRKQLMLPDLIGSIEQTLVEVGLKGSDLELEITESGILEQNEIAYANLSSLRASGIHLAIDDFGTGYSSLVNLKQFPLSRLKIDRSFVRDVTHDKNDEAIIRAIVALGKSFDLKIIAEGVETQEQLDFLLREGCDEAQGFLLGKPVPPDMISTQLVAEKSSTVRQ
ncbi:MAG: putative bifunctional diguanylate cyclase/phosphodiesterase [bacterium]